MEYVEEAPVTGKGLGSTAVLFTDPAGPAGGAGDMHNDYLKIWAQLGIVGLAAYLLGIAAVFRSAIREGRQWLRRVAISRFDLDPRARAVWLAVPGCLVGFLFVSYFDNGIANAVHLGVAVFALAGIASRLADSASNVE
jgi:O-antigen ligase